MADLHLFTDSVETYVAHSAEDAAAAQREFTGMTEQEQIDSSGGTAADAFEQLPDDKELGIWLDEEMKEHRTKTCAEWAAEKGRGFLCSTEW